MYRHIFDRSNLDEVVARKVGSDGKYSVAITRRMDLESGLMPRADIVLFNGTRSGKEYCLFVQKEGFAGDTWILDMLTDEEYDQVQQIANRMRKNAETFSPAWKLL